MRGFARPVYRRELFANYVGSIGYYSWHFAWVLLLVQVLLQVSQYFIVAQRVMIDVSNTKAVEQNSGEIGGISLVGVVLTCLLVVLCAVLLPYYIGKISRQLPRFIVNETSWPLTVNNVLRVKLFACFAVVIVAVVCVFVPEGVSGSNLGFMVVVASALIAGVFFSVQHKLAALWHIPERYLF